jgi:hypothetical protein
VDSRQRATDPYGFVIVEDSNHFEEMVLRAMDAVTDTDPNTQDGPGYGPFHLEVGSIRWREYPIERNRLSEVQRLGPFPNNDPVVGA